MVLAPKSTLGKFLVALQSYSMEDSGAFGIPSVSFQELW